MISMLWWQHKNLVSVCFSKMLEQTMKSIKTSYTLSHSLASNVEITSKQCQNYILASNV